jgi:hypothetical protein
VYEQNLSTKVKYNLYFNKSLHEKFKKEKLQTINNCLLKAITE